MPAKRRILIVDAHALVRRGLASLIDGEPDLSVCAAVGTPQEGLEAIASAGPDLVIVDLSFEEGLGLDLVRKILSRHPDMPVLIISILDAPIYAERAFEAGATGYVTKQELDETVLIAIRTVLAGDKYLSSKLRPDLARR
jgi:DNA-binding NarL/FixJ family response regulator